MIAQAKKMDFF